jgi:aspartyl-tRNA(Asn)/glutamyl-tRNA(Gln) amidotransferase subunit A
VKDYLAELDRDVSNLRLGLVREMWADPIHPEVRRLTRAAVDMLANLGLKVDEVSLPIAAAAVPAMGVIRSAEAVQYHSKWLRERPADYGPGLVAQLLVGAGLTASDVVLAHRVRRQAVHEFRAAMREIDILVSPTVSVTAPQLGEEIVDVGDSRVPFRQVMARLTRIYNLTGLPALSIPCGFASSGMPVGVQLAAKPFDEATLLRVGHAYEQEAGWLSRRPPLS